MHILFFLFFSDFQRYKGK